MSDQHAMLRRALFEQSNDGVVIIGPDHRVIEANARFADMLGYAPEEVVGLHTWDYEAVMPEAEIRRSFVDVRGFAARSSVAPRSRAATGARTGRSTTSR
ncbi:MAG: PAS domain-containing protein [Vicinamibacteria bacterium]